MPRDWFLDYFTPPALDAWQRAQTQDVTLQETAFLESVLLREQTSARLLDAPCGDGRHAAQLAKLGHRVTGVDIAPDNARRAQLMAAEVGAAFEFVLADMRALPEREPFDGAYCWGTASATCRARRVSCSCRPSHSACPPVRAS
jgi:2-polyprenyl-3-methyl-5-hydroxy-6-metoxy-1,4-benzoquinol methylase